MENSQSSQIFKNNKEEKHGDEEQQAEEFEDDKERSWKKGMTWTFIRRSTTPTPTTANATSGRISARMSLMENATTTRARIIAKRTKNSRTTTLAMAKSP